MPKLISCPQCSECGDNILDVRKEFFQYREPGYAIPVKTGILVGITAFPCEHDVPVEEWDNLTWKYDHSASV